MSDSSDAEWNNTDKLMEKQGGKCGGCQIPLTRVYRDESDIKKWKTEGGSLGFVNLRIPKRLKGKAVPSNSWLLCSDCLGSTTVNSQMPTWLYNKAKAYRDENPEDFRSMTHLMRTALEQYILSEDELKEMGRMVEIGRELEINLAKWIELMPDQLTQLVLRLEGVDDGAHSLEED